MFLTLIAVLVLTALYVFLVEPLWVLPWLEWLTPGILYRVRTREALVALSFDDGPHAEFTPQVLEILERYGAKATFFLIGERAERHPELVERIRTAGHEIGNHYWRDGSVLGHSRKRFAEGLESTERAIGYMSGAKASVGSQNCNAQKWTETEVACLGGQSGDWRSQDDEPLRFFRAPGGMAWSWQLRLARERGYTCVLGCAYPHDPMRLPVRYMKWLIEKNLRPGTIAILHDGIRDARKSIEVLPQILETGKRKGLRFVSIGELMKAVEGDC